MFTPSRLEHARKVRGLSLVRLAESAGITARSLSSYENEHGEPSAETLESLAFALDFPISFFSAEDLDPLPLDAVSFRAASKLTAGKRDMALTAGRLAIELHEWIGTRFRLPAPDIPSLPRFSAAYPDQQSLGATKPNGPELAAEIVRARWGLGNAPITNMVHLLEAHGVRVCSLAERCADVDAFSLWWEDTPYVFLNVRKSAERSRFDAAHELGHLILQGEEQNPHGPEAEREANRFAAAFLMPRDSVLARLPLNPSIQHIIQAKRIWKVAAMALAHRLHEIGLSTDWHYRSTCYELGKRGYRSKERYGIARETSQVLDKVFRTLRSEGTTATSIARDLHISPDVLSELVFGLVVTTVDGEGSGGSSQRPELHLVK
jgi:Zn-dependent peptidase ImmA (M78 family)/transcriptional regulator with XRE-family HTH domain